MVGATLFEIFNLCLQQMDLETKLGTKVFKYLENVCLYFAKMILYDYDLIADKSYSLLTGSLIFVAFKIIE
jgi:hypothetical protein